MIDNFEIKCLMTKCLTHDSLSEEEQNKLYQYFQDVKNFEQAMLLFTRMLGMNRLNKYAGLGSDNCIGDCRECILGKYVD